MERNVQDEKKELEDDDEENEIAVRWNLFNFSRFSNGKFLRIW